MPKLTTPAVLLGAFLALNGCGGTSSSPTSPTSETVPDRFRAALPDGTPMVLVVQSRQNGIVTGSFAVASEKGDYAYQSGSFIGTGSANKVEFQCVASDGKEFTLTGMAQSSDGSLLLTRSDLAGHSLTFRPVASSAPAGNRAPVSFSLTTGGTNGRVMVESTPASVTTSGTTTITEHKGTWQGVPVIFWAYNNGTSNLTIYIDPMCVSSQVFSNYRLSDFGTKTVTAGAGQMTMYSSVTRTQIKYKVTPTASP